MADLHWNAETLRLQLEPLCPGIAVEIVASTGSTSTDLLERLHGAARPASDLPEVQVRRSMESRAYHAAAPAAPWRPCLRVAEAQTAGRGRLGRSWHAERGATLTFSLALPLAAPASGGLSLAVGVALADALEPATSGAAPRLALKWPNDLWLRDAAGAGRKLGGVLIETVTRGAQRIAVLGIGLNVRPVAAPPGEGHRWAALDEIEPAATAPAVLARIAVPLLEAVKRFESAGLAPFLAGYARRDLLAGQAVRTTGAEAFDGVAEGIAEDGCLRVRLADGALRRVQSGEVSVRLRAAVPGAAA